MKEIKFKRINYQGSIIYVDTTKIAVIKKEDDGNYTLCLAIPRDDLKANEPRKFCYCTEYEEGQFSKLYIAKEEVRDIFESWNRYRFFDSYQLRLIEEAYDED